MQQSRITSLFLGRLNIFDIDLEIRSRFNQNSIPDSVLIPHSLGLRWGANKGSGAKYNIMGVFPNYVNNVNKEKAEKLTLIHLKTA